MVEWLTRGVTAQEEQAVTAFMERLAKVPAASRCPDADVVWWKAQLLARWDAERKVQMPLDVMEPIQIAAGFVAAGLLLIWSLPSIMRLLAQWST